MKKRNTIDIARHQEVFNPIMNDRRVHVIGAGAVGSHVVYHLAKLGMSDIFVYDDDSVEAHNLANQLFFPRHVGGKKATQIAEFVNENMEQQLVTAVEGWVTTSEDLELTEQRDIVFLLVDTIKARQEIMDELVLSGMVALVVETRMAVSHHETYVVRPDNPVEVEAWEASLPAEDVYEEVSACGSALSVGATADSLACTALWQMVHALNGPQEVDFARKYSFRDGAGGVTPPLLQSEAKIL